MYQGGVVQRRVPRGSEDSLLTIGYASTDSPYIVLG